MNIPISEQKARETDYETFDGVLAIGLPPPLAETICAYINPALCNVCVLLFEQLEKCNECEKHVCNECGTRTIPYRELAGTRIPLTCHECTTDAYFRVHEERRTDLWYDSD